MLPGHQCRRRQRHFEWHSLLQPPLHTACSTHPPAQTPLAVCTRNSPSAGVRAAQQHNTAQHSKAQHHTQYSDAYTESQDKGGDAALLRVPATQPHAGKNWYRTSHASWIAVSSSLARETRSCSHIVHPHVTQHVTQNNNRRPHTSQRDLSDAPKPIPNPPTTTPPSHTAAQQRHAHRTFNSVCACAQSRSPPSSSAPASSAAVAVSAAAAAAPTPAPSPSALTLSPSSALSTTTAFASPSVLTSPCVAAAGADEAAATVTTSSTPPSLASTPAEPSAAVMSSPASENSASGSLSLPSACVERTP